MTITASVNLIVDGSISTRMVSPAVMAATEDDYAGAIGFSFARLTPDPGDTTITGFNIGGTLVERNGLQLVLVNLGNANIVIAYEGLTSTDEFRIITKTLADTVIPADGTMTLIYDSVTQRWRQTG